MSDDPLHTQRLLSILERVEGVLRTTASSSDAQAYNTLKKAHDDLKQKQEQAMSRLDVLMEQIQTKGVENV